MKYSIAILFSVLLINCKTQHQAKTPGAIQQDTTPAGATLDNTYWKLTELQMPR